MPGTFTPTVCGPWAAGRYGLTDCMGRAADHPTKPRAGCACDACEANREAEIEARARRDEFRRRYPTTWRELKGNEARNSALDAYDFAHVANADGLLRGWMTREQWAERFYRGADVDWRSVAARHWLRLLARWRQVGLRYEIRRLPDANGTRAVRVHPDGLTVARALLLADWDPELDPPTPTRDVGDTAAPVARAVSRLRLVRLKRANRADAWDAHVARALSWAGGVAC